MYGLSVYSTEDVVRKYNEIDLQSYSFFYCVRGRIVFSYIFHRLIKNE